MAAFIFVAESWKAHPANPQERSVLLESNGYYWFLYRYFEGANVTHKSELIDLYDGGEITGYQLHRLETELRTAAEDVARKPDRWQVLIGWNGAEAAMDTENWSEVQRDKMSELIQRLLWLIDYAKDRKLKLICSGD
jgi:hypothetical protein